MIEAVCILGCYDSEAGIVYERDGVYQIDEKRFAVPPKDMDVRQRQQARMRGLMVPNGLIKHFRTKYQLESGIAEEVEARAHGETARPRKPRIISTPKSSPKSSRK